MPSEVEVKLSDEKGCASPAEGEVTTGEADMVRKLRETPGSAFKVEAADMIESLARERDTLRACNKTGDATLAEVQRKNASLRAKLAQYIPARDDAATFHDRVWNAWREAKSRDAMLGKLSVHSIRVLCDVLFDAHQ